MMIDFGGLVQAELNKICVKIDITVSFKVGKYLTNERGIVLNDGYLNGDATTGSGGNICLV